MEPLPFDAAAAEELFARALPLPLPERQRLLADVADVALRREVEALLGWDVLSRASLDAPLVGRAEPAPAGALAAGTRVGGYVVLEALGRGGMGLVHRARHAGSGELVALKTVAAPSAFAVDG